MFSAGITVRLVIIDDLSEILFAKSVESRSKGTASILCSTSFEVVFVVTTGKIGFVGKVPF